MTREKLGAYRDQFYASLDTNHMPRESIAESVFDRVCNALEAVMDERDQLLVERASVVDWTNTQLREHGLPEIESPRIAEDLKSAIRLLSETAHKYAIERDHLKYRVRELERGEYVCKKCGLRKDGESPIIEF
jgi:hypothetical protein